MGEVNVWQWLIVLAVVAFYVTPIVRIITKAGFSVWWTPLFLVPFVNLIALWVFAFVPWPALTPERRNDR